MATESGYRRRGRLPRSGEGHRYRAGRELGLVVRLDMDDDPKRGDLGPQRFLDAVTIFVVPPSAEALVARLAGRNTESTETLALRLRNAVKELEEASRYQHVVVNDNLDDAIAKVSGIIDEETVKRQRLPALGEDVDRIVERIQQELLAKL